MKRLAIAVFIATLPAHAWQKVCTFTFDKNYDGVHIEKVKVVREKVNNTWSYAVGLSGVRVSGHKCAKGERLTAYVSAKVKSSSAGYLDTGDLKVRGRKADVYWKFFDDVHLKNCEDGVRLWASWVCEKVISPEAQ